MPDNLVNKVAVVPRAASGMGCVIATASVAEAGEVVIADIDCARR